MKYAFLGSKPAVVILGLILGLYVGFKIANSQYRLGQEKSLNSTIASAQAGQGEPSSGTGLEEARRMIEKAQSSPGDIEAQLDAADQFIQIGRPEEALTFLQQAYTINQKDSRVLAGLGMANFMSGKYQEAIQYASQSLAVTPENPGASFLLIASYIRTNQKLDEAEKMIKQLEASGVDQAMIGRVRQELEAARGGKGAGAKTTLEHGPDESLPANQKK